MNWECLDCRFSNRSSDKYCVNCGADKNNKNWKCKNCQWINSVSSDYCKFCQIPKEQVKKLRDEGKYARNRSHFKEATRPEIKRRKKAKVPISDLPSDSNKYPRWIISLSRNILPEDLKGFGYKASDLLEIYTAKMFRELLALDCQLWGSENTRFKEFADGYFIIPRSNKIVLFDTKAYGKGYNASKELLKSANSITKNKADMAAQKLEPTHFLMISYGFRGDEEKQVGNFYDNCNIKLKLCEAYVLIDFAKSVRRIKASATFLQSVRWSEILSINAPRLLKRNCEKELKRLKETLTLYQA